MIDANDSSPACSLESPKSTTSSSFSGFFYMSELMVVGARCRLRGVPFSPFLPAACLQCACVGGVIFCDGAYLCLVFKFSLVGLFLFAREQTDTCPPRTNQGSESQIHMRTLPDFSATDPSYTVGVTSTLLCRRAFCLCDSAIEGAAPNVPTGTTGAIEIFARVPHATASTAPRLPSAPCSSPRPHPRTPPPENHLSELFPG